MRLTYAEIQHDDAARDAVFARMSAEGLLGCAMSAFAAPSLDDWRRITDPTHGVLLCCSDADTGEPLGVGQFERWFGQVWRFDFTAFRAGFGCAAKQAQGGFAHLFERHGASAIVGITPVLFRHAWGLAQACGFRLLARLPGACWLARKNRFVDGVLVMCTPQTLRAAQERSKNMGFGGGGGGEVTVPEVTPTPKAEVTKPVTEAATSARQSQKDKAKRAAGLASTILTDQSPTSSVSGKTLLGQ